MEVIFRISTKSSLDITQPALFNNTEKNGPEKDFSMFQGAGTSDL